MPADTLLRDPAPDFEREPFDAPVGKILFEFRDTSFHAQVAMGVVGAVVAAAVMGAVKLGLGGSPAYLIAAGVAAITGLAALGFVYWRFGQPAGLRLTDSELTVIRGGAEKVILLGELAAFRFELSDYSLNGVYQQTRFRFQFASQEPSSPPLSYDAQATFGAPKFDQLQALQAFLSDVVARGMREQLTSGGRVSWTERLAITPSGLEITSRDDAPRAVPFSHLTRWEVDQGLFKLALDGSDRPTIVEKANQWNFYPGLVLLKEMSA
jgi:hypothetical protein